MYLCVYPIVCLLIYPCAYSFLFVCLPVCFFVALFVCFFLTLLFCYFIYFFVCPMYSPIYPSVRLYMYLSTCLSIHLLVLSPQTPHSLCVPLRHLFLTTIHLSLTLPPFLPSFHPPSHPHTNPIHHKLHRFVLGSYPKDERARLCEVLTRTLTRQIATKGILKMRTSAGIDVHDYW